MWMWREFDPGEVRDDMAQIADIGFDVVRFFALTRDFLTGPMTVAPEMVRRLESVAIAAKDAGLRSMPTLITINMSGRFWWPSWMLDSQGRAADLFSDPAILRSQALLVDACARALAGDVSIRAFDLSNEIDDAQQPKSRDAGWLWASLLANTIRRAAPGTPVQIGAHLLSLTTPEYLRIDDLAGIADDDVMHAYPLYCKTARSFLDPELVPFSCALTSGLAASGRATLMQEFGLCTAEKGSPGYTIVDDFLGRPLSQYLASEDEAATYYGEVLESINSTCASGA
jgi:endo-1,4-beta-mannosidase